MGSGDLSLLCPTERQLDSKVDAAEGTAGTLTGHALPREVSGIGSHAVIPPGEIQTRAGHPSKQRAARVPPAAWPSFVNWLCLEEGLPMPTRARRSLVGVTARSCQITHPERSQG